MIKKLGSIVISTALACALTTGVFAADPLAMQDISGHWASEDICWAMTEDLLKGVSDTQFAPEETMTRGQFVTVLGRLAGIDPADYQDDYLPGLYTDLDADAYYAPYINWATRYGIVRGTDGGRFEPDAGITREQMATVLIRYASIYNYELTMVDSNTVDAFADDWSIAEYARDSVETLRNTGILTGIANGDGTYNFQPQDEVTRAQGAVVFRRLSHSLVPYTGRETVDPESITLRETTAEMKIAQTMPMSASIAPEESTNKTLTWVSLDPSIAKVDSDGNVTALAEGTVEIRGYTWNGLYASCTITVQRDTSLAYAGESYEEKCIRVFGQVVEDPKEFYNLEDTSYLVSVPVRVWDFADKTYTTKVTKTIYVQVHANLADTIQAIFEEIYNGDEQFPISSAGGYYYSTYSEHTPGLAIDINPNENYECKLDGTPMTGKYWKPGEDPYSIPADGDVVQAFKKYGFGWGGDWRSKKDYMHFSYFST